MSVRDLEIELARRRDPAADHPPSGAVALGIDEALEYRNAGNVPDSAGRSLRLVLKIDDEPLSLKRLRFEPDFHEAPAWRRPGSKPVNVVPLAPSTDKRSRTGEEEWWAQPDVAALESEWRQTGTIAAMKVPEMYRSFVLKTVVSLRQAGVEVDPESVLASVSRWLSPDQVEELREALEQDAR